MSELVAADAIEQLVGAKRHPTRHQARAVSADQTVYVLHSAECRDSGIDLRTCRWSLALDNGIRLSEWTEDVAVFVRVEGAYDDTRLVPNA